MPIRSSRASVVLVGLLLAAPAAADTIITGGTVINQTWTTAGSPYILQGDVTIPNGAFLTIEAGVTVQAQSTSDSQMTGLDTSRVELTVAGTLTVNGTAGNPVLFRSTSTTSGTWYGIVVAAGATAATIDYAQIQDARYDLQTSAPGTVLDASHVTTFEASNYGLWVRAGTPVVDGLVSYSNGTAGVMVEESGALTLTGCVVRNNSSYGIAFQPTSSRTLAVDNCSINANGTYGVYTGASTAGTVTISDSVITNHSYGVYRGDTSSVSTTYSDVWNNSSGNFISTSAGTGCIQINPLYVSTIDLRLTANSPARFGANGGGDMGALPYISDATPGLYGTLWVNTTLTVAQSPYTVGGDLAVPPGVTLTIQPGVTLQFQSTSDIMMAGNDTSRGELIVNGTLIADGTASQPITLLSTSTTSGTWYGIDLQASANNVVIDNVTVQDARYDVVYRSAMSGNVLSALTTREASNYGVWVRAGSPTITTLTSTNNGTAGVMVEESGALTLGNCVVRNNSSYGIAFQPTSSRTLAVDNCSINANGTYGVYTGASTAGTVTISDSIITNHSYGVYRGDTSSVSTTYSDVWNNSSGNFISTSAGTGCIQINPLYVSTIDLRLTANSPARFGANGGGDMGALPYISDATPGLYGTLWVNTTLTVAQSPYTVGGDLSVPPGVTLTIQPGVTLQFQSTSDIMIAGNDTSRGELIVNGALIADGTSAQPITLLSTSTTSGTWYGIDLQAAANNVVIDNVTVQDARYNVVYRSTASGNAISQLVVREASNYGVWVRAGSPSIDALTANNNGTAGVMVEESGALTLSNAVVRNNSSYGVAFQPTSSRTLVLDNPSINANGTYGVYTGASTAGTVTIKNAIITNHSYGVYRGDTSSVSTAYSDVWNNSSGNFISTSAGTGCISQNPNYTSTTDLRLQGSSVAIDAGTTGPLVDAVGVVRPQDGNGIGGTQWDMGAYEYVLTAMCGNGAVEPGETCDSGSANGMYGACNASCTGLGPRCGDSTTNGPEQCDDGNTSNTDACLNTCRSAACGDGYLRAGSEQCDDGNMLNTDSCVGTCMTARCGDGYTQTGVEQCDDGNTNNADACSNVCMASTCGDGIVQAGEECDDNNMVNTDSCLNSCLAARCGDNVVRTGVETCDDGNTIATDACTATCQSAVCGDGITRAGTEECDDANMVNTDACVGVCVAATCGDGYLRAGVEGCDDGNMVNTDACTNACVSSTCGDGVVQAGAETCDDANSVDTDACRNNCSLAMCGDNVLQTGVEDCDDGNTAAGDGCSPTCEVETGPDGGTGPDAGNPGDGDGGGGCCSASAGARETGLLAALCVALAIRRRRRFTRG
jgi:cysteine-rich repeat protein